MAEAAVLRGRLEVMQLLRERFGPGIFTAGDLKAAAGLGHFQALRYLITLWRDTEGAAAESGGEAPSWDQVFGLAARSGAGVELLRLLHEGCGAVVDLGAVAAGGGEAALEWAVGELRAAGQVGGGLGADKVGAGRAGADRAGAACCAMLCYVVWGAARGLKGVSGRGTLSRCCCSAIVGLCGLVC